MTTSPSPAPRPARGGIRARLLLVLLAIGAGGSFAGLEVRDRLHYVTETDARIRADLVTVSSRVAGWVTRIEVREGERLAPNAVLATIDDRESRLLVGQLESQVAALEADRARLAAERELVDLQTASRYETQRQALAAAEASVSALLAQLELARSELARAQSLRGSMVISAQQLDQARAAARRLDGEHRMAMAEREESLARLEEARAERARLTVLDREIEGLAHRRAELLGRIEQQKLDLADRVIRSPGAVVVDRLFVEAGEFVSPGQRIALVHDPEQVWVEANIKETQIRRLRLGLQVEVTVDAFPDEAFVGRVDNIGSSTTGSFALLPTPNPSGNFTKITQRLPVRIAVEQREQRLRPGMMVEVRIDVGDG
ncbi:MAG: HlyD family secretion protein [Ectothiorhodospiraceae bacterium]|nr:HlyD family secretion protein [Chromatiales bacterium]MCP5156741.1 HlyD family secretion protein [Ectothiorhodospiraceae bacterium]